MKVTCLLFFVTIINGQLVSGALYAAPRDPAQTQAASEGSPKAVTTPVDRPSDDRPQSDAKANGDTRKHRRTPTSLQSSKAVAINSTRPGQVAGRQALASAGNPANASSGSAVRPGTTEGRGSAQNEAIYRALPVRPGAVMQPVSSSTGLVRHRDPNAPLIGGAASSKARSTAAIDGTRITLRNPRN